MDDKRAAQKFEFGALFEQWGSDDAIAKRALSVLRWKIRYQSIQIQAEKGPPDSLGRGRLVFRSRSGRAYSKLSGVVGVTNLIVAIEPKEPPVIRGFQTAAREEGIASL